MRVSERQEEGGEEFLGAGAVFERAGANCSGELVLGKCTGALCKEAEEQASEKDVEGMATGGGVEKVRVGGEELVKKLSHALGGLDVGVRFGGVLGFFHALPGQEEAKMVGDIPDGNDEVFAGFSVYGEEFFVIGDDDQAGIRAFDVCGASRSSAETARRPLSAVASWK